MTDWDDIWRRQDEARTIVNAVVGEGIWNICYNSGRQVIEVELTVHLDENAVTDLCSQFTIAADYDGEGSHGTKFVLYV